MLGPIATGRLPLSGGTVNGSLLVTGGVTINGAFAHGGTTVGFYNVTPAARPAALVQTYATADRTLAALTAAALTNANGTGDTTIADVGVAFNQATLNNNFRDVSDMINKLVADHADLAQFVNSLVDDMQLNGLEQ